VLHARMVCACMPCGLEVQDTKDEHLDTDSSAVPIGRQQSVSNRTKQGIGRTLSGNYTCDGTNMQPYLAVDDVSMAGARPRVVGCTRTTNTERANTHGSPRTLDV